MLPFIGGTLVEYQIDTLLAAGAQQVVVVTGHRVDEVVQVAMLKRVTIVRNADYASGRASSVRAGVASVDPRATAALFLNVDQPRPTAMVVKVISAHARGGALVTMPTFEGHGGHPVIFDASLFPDLAAVTEAGQGLREVVQRHRAATQRVEVDSELALFDMNTPDDYQQALRLFGESPANP